VNWLTRYARWLHLGWPAGTVEKLPEVGERGRTNLPGVYIVGDLSGVPLLKFALDGGTRAVREFVEAFGNEGSRRAGGAGATARGTAVARGVEAATRGTAVARGAEAATRGTAVARGAEAASPLDLVIVGAGVAGMAAAVEARAQGLRFELLEASEPFSTLVNFPRAKPIYTYPRAMTPEGRLQVKATVKEPLLDELRAQAEAHDVRPRTARAERIERANGRLRVHLADGAPPLETRGVIVAIGRSGSFRKLGVPGEELDKVFNRLHDPRDFADQEVLVVGGGDSALEGAIALAESGARVTLSYRGTEFARAKPDNVAMVEALRNDPMADVTLEQPSSERVTTSAGRFQGASRRPGSITLRLGTVVTAIRENEVDLAPAGENGRGRRGGASGTVPNAGTGSPGAAAAATRVETLPNDVVFAAIGREAPLDFFRRSGLRIAGELSARSWAALAAFLLFCTWLYDWKSGGVFSSLWYRNGWWPTQLAAGVSAGGAVDPTSLAGIVLISASGPSFWYTLAYSLIVVGFGIARIRRRRTPYVTAQTVTLMLVQVIPLFLLPEIVLPWMNHHGILPTALADALFPAVDYGHGREFWRAYGFILAWPLMIYNVFTDQPLFWWLAIAVVQTLVLIPLGIYFFGKGFYCGWICSCGALAETLGDTHRHRMPHGARWNRLNFIGQALLAVAILLLVLRIVGWLDPASWAALQFQKLKDGWKWGVDVLLAGILGYGLYFWFSGRTWCRFACPLAALMHVYARFSRFRILADKKKCISCNVCTSVCHQGIDIMNFANKGLPMADPQCVRCSACVQQCPTGVLTFGQVDRAGRVVAVDRLAASPVQMREGAGG
jgi:NosR/NirI family nitrous oxide reductase transcriptional regulator